MKSNWIALVLVVSLSALLLIACGSRDDAGKGAAGSGGTGGTGGTTTEFEMADLGGGWSIFGVSSGGANEGTIYGILDLNTSGLVLNGGYGHSDGVSSADFDILGGTFTIDEDDGVLGGTADTDLPSTITVASGKMNASKNVFTFVASTDAGEENMFVAIKNVITGGEEYEDDDLDELWYLFGASSGGTNEGYIRGWISMDDEPGEGEEDIEGVIPVLGGAFTHSDGTITGITGGDITISTGGRLSGTATTNNVTPITITYGKMNLAKDALSMYATDAMDNYMLVAIKQVGEDAFTESDLEGTWYISGSSSGGADGTIRGTIILEAGDTGIANVTGGSYIHSDGTVATLTGGIFPINGEGLLSSGNETPFITTDTPFTITVIQGKMNNAKDVISYVANTTAGGLEMVFAVKGDTILQP